MRQLRFTLSSWIAVLILLAMPCLAGWRQAPPATATSLPTLTSLATSALPSANAPSPSSAQPEKPVTDPTGQITVAAGTKLAIQAWSAGALTWKWSLQGDGELSSTTEPAVIYTAPMAGEPIAIVTVTAYNAQGPSTPTSLVIHVLPGAVKRLGELALAVAWAPEGKEPGRFVSQETISSECLTGSDCWRVTYRAGSGLAGLVWVPFSFGMIQNVHCQDPGEWNTLSRQPLCIATMTTQTWDLVRKRTYNMNVLQAGNFASVRRIVWRARGERGGEVVTFGIGDSQVPPRPGQWRRITLSREWREYAIQLEGTDLTDVGALFKLSVSDQDHPQGAVFYLDGVQFEGEKAQPALTSAAEQGSLPSSMQLCWVAYSPTHYDPNRTPVQWPSAEDVREDLRVLREAGFDGLVTYSSYLRDCDAIGQPLDLPRLAQEAGFAGMIVGVWDPKNEDEMRAAEAAGSNPVVLGFSVGNEGWDVRYDLRTLTAAMQRLRRTTQKPVTTTEQAQDYYQNSPLWNISDWIFPNAHPYFAGNRDPQEAVRWTERVFASLTSVSHKPLIFKEVGLPSGGDTGVDESRQASYYQLLGQTDVRYVVFEAFDAPWKHLGRVQADGTYPLPDPEPHWGVFTSERAPKEAAQGICSHPH